MGEQGSTVEDWQSTLLSFEHYQYEGMMQNVKIYFNIFPESLTY